MFFDGCGRGEEEELETRWGKRPIAEKGVRRESISSCEGAER